MNRDELETVKLELVEQKRLTELYSERSRRLSEVVIEHSRTAHGSRRTSDVPVTVTAGQGAPWRWRKKNLDEYFNALQRRIRDVGEESDFDFLMVLTGAEEQLFHDVVAVIGDREFPDDLRQQMLGVFTTKSLYRPHGLVMPRKAYVQAMQRHHSLAVEEMHLLWRELASRKVETRFGVLDSNPTHLAYLRGE